MPTRADISHLTPAEQQRVLARRARNRQHMASTRRDRPERHQEALERRYTKLREMNKNSSEWQRVLATNRTWKRENRDKRSAAYRKKWAEDLPFRLKKNLRLRTYLAVKGSPRAGSAARDLGCSVEELVRHLEDEFTPGMSWENYGSGWHVDHKVPLAWFDLSDRSQFLSAAHYTNLQPKWAKDNLSKGASLDPPTLF